MTTIEPAPVAWTSEEVRSLFESLQQKIADTLALPPELALSLAHAGADEYTAAVRSRWAQAEPLLQQAADLYSRHTFPRAILREEKASLSCC